MALPVLGQIEVGGDAGSQLTSEERDLTRPVGSRPKSTPDAIFGDGISVPNEFFFDPQRETREKEVNPHSIAKHLPSVLEDIGVEVDEGQGTRELRMFAERIWKSVESLTELTTMLAPMVMDAQRAGFRKSVSGLNEYLAISQYLSRP